MRLIAILVAVSIALCANGATNDAGRAEAEALPKAIQAFSTLASLSSRPDAAGLPVTVMAQVVHVCPLLHPNMCVIANMEKPWESGVVAELPPNAPIPDSGDVCMVYGTTKFADWALRVRVDRLQRVRGETLQPANQCKFADLRLGKLKVRRVAVRGRIADILVEKTANGLPMTHFSVLFGHSRAICRVPGRLPPRYASIGEVRVTGCTFSEFDEKGVPVVSYIECENQSAIESLSAIFWWRIGAAFLSVVVAVLLVILFFAWLKFRRVRFAERAVALERQRMAADLHDTIEQNLAAVKILLTCAAKPAGVPDETKKVLEQAAAMLIHAKGEVRSTIMNLRSAGEEGKGLSDHLREMADSLRCGGVSVKVLLRGVPERIDAARLGDVLLIVREAVTNAVKHGKAKTIVIVSDPIPGRSGFVLKVLNDGAPFDVDSALGPETGHFGLAGMRERAARSGFALEFVRDGKWMSVRLEVGE